MIQAFPASWAMPATLVSCSVTPSLASIIMRHTLDRSMAMAARRTENFSIWSVTLAFFRIPAVSMKRNLPVSFSK